MLVIGFWLAVLSLFSPGTGLLEIGALFMLVLAGYSIYHLDFNIWALAILVVGVIPLLFAMRRSRQWVYLALSIAALVVGSIFLVKPAEGIIAIHPGLAVLVSIVSIGLLWIIGRRSIEAINQAPSHNLEDLLGMEGEAHSAIHNEGTVYVGGEEWTAHSEKAIPQGARVKVVGRSGLSLKVEVVKK